MLLLWCAAQAAAAVSSVSFIPLEKRNGAWLMDMSALAKAENMTVEWKAVEKHFSAKNAQVRCSFAVGLPYFSLQGEIIPLHAKTEIDKNGRVWIPAEKAVLPFSKAFKKDFSLDTLQKKVFLSANASPKKESAVISSASVSKTSPAITKQPAATSSSSSAVVLKDDRKAKAGLREVKTIIIDPGHGGKDPGALGQKSQEKDIVLAVAKKLKTILEKDGFEVKLTRSKDSFIELSERANIANKANGDLFISLHCNAIDGEERQKKTQGYHFYVLRAPESEEDKAIARRENKVATLYGDKKSKAEISPIEWIKIEASLAMYQQNSFRFTEKLLDSFNNGKIKKLGTGAGGAGFMVLVGALMPAVLVELGFITHPEDETYMMSDKGQTDLSERIAKAIIIYRDAVHDYRKTLAH